MRRVPRVAAEDFGKPVVLEQLRRLELRAAEPMERRDESVAQETHGKGSLLDRPDRAAMVAVRVVRGIPGRERANAPTAEQIRLEEPRGDPLDAGRIQDPARQTVAGVGGDGADR